MSFSIFNKQLLSIPIFLCIALYCFGQGKAQTGIGGTGIGYIPQPGSGTGAGFGSGVGGGFGNGGGSGFGGINGGIIAKALGCLGDKIYSECEESYRLTERGDLHVPPEHTDLYCGGPCLKETNLVLNCINDVFSNFIFYNRATINAVKDTIKDGCSYGPKRGDFNVPEHIEAYESNSHKFSYRVLVWLLPLILVFVLLF